MKSYLLYIITIVCSLGLQAQKDSEVLLTINSDPVTVDEFKRVYLKNIELLNDESSSDPEQYLDLFISYKLKVQEAYRLGLDKKDTYKNELSGYKKQLAKTFLTDVSITDTLVREAYERMLTEVNARHILVKVQPNASPEDTLASYNRVIEARLKILSGEDFKKVAKEYSDDPSAKTNGGELGWFKAFKMVYPFENAAYKTPVGEVSMPFRTRFGYHIVNTTGTRKAQGARQVAHIMITHKQNDSSVNPKERILKIYDLLEQGENFASLAKTYSNDKQTASKGGELRRFELGQLSSPEFEKVAFQLKNLEEYSSPFQSKFGWHIVKLLKKFPVESFENEKGTLENKVMKDKRAQVISQTLINKLRKQYQKEDISAIVTLAKGESIGKFEDNKWVYKANSANDKIQIFKLNSIPYFMDELGMFLERSFSPKKFGSYDQFFEETVRKYVDVKIQNYHEEHLEELEPEFAGILREYKEGLLIFDLMESEIWSKAKNDSIGLQSFYKNHLMKYKVDKKAVTTVYTSQNKDALEKFKSTLELNNEKGKTEVPVNIIKTEKEINISENNAFAEGYIPRLGMSDVLAHNGGFFLYNISNITLERTKTLEEAKGLVISDYQEFLEKTWLNRLVSQANVSVEKKVLKKLIKQYK